MNLILKRIFQNEHKTLGNLFLFDQGKIICMLKTLELPWKDNQKYISCIPEGTYGIVYPYSGTKYNDVFMLTRVPGRSGILIHAGNYTSQIEGCILPGVLHDDINNDGIKDVKHSGIAMEVLRYYVRQGEDLILTVRK